MAMKISKNKAKDGLVIKNISNESMLEMIEDYIRESGCQSKFSNCLTKANISGSCEQLNKFIALWNN